MAANIRITPVQPIDRPERQADTAGLWRAVAVVRNRLFGV
jgi:hypothetical protein